MTRTITAPGQGPSTSADTITLHRDPFTLECFREMHGESNNDGPIGIAIWPDGRISIERGWQEAYSLFCSDQPIRAKVLHRHERWLQIKARDNPLYSFHPHPDLVGNRAIRTNPKRFMVASDELRQAGLTGKLLMIGCCSGLGPATLAGLGWQVAAIDYVPERTALAIMWARAANLPFVCLNVQLDDYEVPGDIETAIGFGVWHHLARDKESLVRRIKKIAHCPAAIIELPDDDKGPWHSKYTSQCKNKVEELYEMFSEIGGFSNRKLIYTDVDYHNRETYLLTK